MQFDWKTNTEVNGRFEWDSAPTEKVCYRIEAYGYDRIQGLALMADGSEHEINSKGRRNND